MKCDNCFFCTKIGKGVLADYPLKYCKHDKKYFEPFVKDDDNGTLRPLDFNNYDDLKIWNDVGCNIHPSTVAKTKKDMFKRLGS